MGTKVFGRNVPDISLFSQYNSCSLIIEPSRCRSKEENQKKLLTYAFDIFIQLQNQPWVKSLFVASDLKAVLNFN